MVGTVATWEHTLPLQGPLLLSSSQLFREGRRATVPGLTAFSRDARYPDFNVKNYQLKKKMLVQIFKNATSAKATHLQARCVPRAMSL